MGQASGQLERVLQARFTEALMKDKAKVDFSADRIFSTAETGQPKSEVLKQLEQKHPGTSYHFVEDKLGTLDKVGSNVSTLVPSCSFKLEHHVDIPVPPSPCITDCKKVGACTKYIKKRSFLVCIQIVVMVGCFQRLGDALAADS